MALMSEERRKEMEEEMSRFELEIAAPSAVKSSSNDMLIGSKPLSPPPAPPAVAVLIPEVLAKAPPPPPPSASPPLHVVLGPPPPPPPLPLPPSVPIQAHPQASPMRFIPHQLHRHPPRPPMRPNFVPMRGLHIEGHPGPFPSPAVIGPFIPPMGQPPPMVGPQIPGPPMHHMGPGPMPMVHGPMPMPPQMGNINISLPMPPGFCPPTGPLPPMMPGTLPCDTQTFMPSDEIQDFEPVSIPESSNETNSVVVAAPAIYASPFVKSHAENMDISITANGQENIITSSGVMSIPKFEKFSSIKTEEHIVGPTAPSATTNEEIVVSKKKEKKKKCVRMAGGQAWEDNSLIEWDPDDFRIFCGDLGNDVTDEVLIRAFSKYASFVKAKVIRDKRTNKTKGYGFVSFKDPQDFIKAMREMNGKYVGSRPIKLRKSTWKDRNIDLVKKKQREKEKLGLL